MDTSEQYIKMCEKAKEIQAQWKPTEADFMYNFAVGEVTFIRVNRTTDRRRRHHSIPYNKDRFFWLPRQDQLQEMFCTNGYVLSQMIEGAIEDWLALGECPSMEQLWLAFVMKEKYNKVWNGEDWVDV